MAWTIFSPLAGAAVSGLTSPTYTLALDKAPTPYGVQYVCTALGGTQPGVSVHSPSKPFTAMLAKPQVVRAAAPARTNSNSLIANVRNKWNMVIRKGGLVNASLAIPGVATVRINWDIPAGFEDASPAELAALMSFMGGLFSAPNAQSFTDALRTGTI